MEHREQKLFDPQAHTYHLQNLEIQQMISGIGYFVEEVRNQRVLPTSISLYQHNLRANYQNVAWKQCLEQEQKLPSPVRNGLMRMDENGWITTSGTFDK